MLPWAELPPPSWPPKEPKGSAAWEGEAEASATRATASVARTMLRFIAAFLRPSPSGRRAARAPQTQEGSRHVRLHLKYYVNFSGNCKRRSGGKSIIDEHQSLPKDWPASPFKCASTRRGRLGIS